MSDDIPQFNGSQTANFLTLAQWFDRKLGDVTKKIDEHIASEAEIHQAFAAHLASEDANAKRWSDLRKFARENWQRIAVLVVLFAGALLGAVGLDDVLQHIGV